MMRQQGRSAWLLSISMLIGVWYQACGIITPKYVNYDEEPSADPPPVIEEPSDDPEPEDTCAEEALTLFSETIDPVLTTVCIGCHAGTPIAGIALSASSVSGNRDALFAYTGTDPNVLFDKINLTSQPAHGGGNFSSSLSLAIIEAWTTKEAECVAAE